MEMHKHNEEIYEIKNFITDEEIDQLLSFVNLTGDEDWNYTHIGNVLNVMKNEKDQIDSKIIFEKIENRVNSYFINQTQCTGFQNIRRLKKDEFMPMHEDSDHNPEKDPIMFGVVIFLNDDFDGGELFYSDIDLKIKPTKNSLFMHKATYNHEVLPVINGNRYCITTFIRGNENTQILVK